MKVVFRIHYNTVWGQKLCVVGSIPQLGNWESVLAKEMRYVADGEWALELDLPENVEQIAYRYFVRMYRPCTSLRCAGNYAGYLWS